MKFRFEFVIRSLAVAGAKPLVRLSLRLAALACASLVAFAAMATRVAADEWERRDLLSFGQVDPQGGRNPEDPPILGADGALYGTTRSGGAFGRGVAYRFQPSDNSYRVLRHFVGGTDGGQPFGSTLVQANDGRLYGLALNPRLVLWSLAPDGSDYRIVFTFPAGAEQGGTFAVVPSLTVGPGNLLFGIYVTGGPNTPPSTGTLFRLARDGTGFQSLATVSVPSSPIVLGAAGQLFGTTSASLYRLNADGTGFTTLVNFPPPPFGDAQAESLFRRPADGFLYGWTNRGGASNFGRFYRIREDGSDFQALFDPTVVTEGGHYRAPARDGGDGFLYGSAGEDGFGTQSFFWRIRPDGTGWQVLRRISFNGRGSNGVTLAPDGLLYSFTTGGPGGNTLVRLARDGSAITTVHNFPSAEGFPLTPIALARGADQRLYGLSDRDGTSGTGTLFRVSPDGSGFAVMRDFGAFPAEGLVSNPKALGAAPDGSIFGIVRRLGADGAAIFRFRPDDGDFAWIHLFDATTFADTAGLLVGSDGLLYGALDTAVSRTARLFRCALDGSGFTVLRTFVSSNASGIGSAALAEGPDARLYGVTTRNGASALPLLYRLERDGSGYQALLDVAIGTNPATNPPRGLLLTPNGRIHGFADQVLWACAADGSSFTALHTFAATARGERPLLGFDGRIYGVLPFGGTAARGAVFRVNSDGSGYEEVVSFPSDPLSGQNPNGFLVTAPDGAYVGLAAGGGTANHGTLFRVATPTQLVGIAPGTIGFQGAGGFGGVVIGPPARPVDVWRSNDLQTWILLQSIADPSAGATFLDPDATSRPARFYRATTP